MHLVHYIAGRDNNFNLIRIAAAITVLVTHCFTLTAGSDIDEPLRGRLGFSAGDIAVDVFFVISGFLVTASLKRKRSALDFVCSRMLRILPGLALMLFITVFGMGVVLTTLPLAGYLSSPDTYAYLVKGLTLFGGVGHQLPGVLETLPIKSVNGSLWSMPHEVRMYALLLVLWMAASLVGRWRTAVFRGLILVGAAIFGLLAAYRWYAWGGKSYPVWLAFMFLSGAAAYVLRERIVLSWRILAPSLICLPLAAVRLPWVFAPLYLVSLAYLALGLAYLPGGAVRRYNAIGDYSFGIYIYAFPIQQAIVGALGPISPWAVAALALPIAGVFAVASWHLVESRALGWKSGWIESTRRALPALGRAPPA